MMDEMMAMQMTKDPDNDFAMMMKIHHLGAIDMANLELKNGNDEQLKAMAQTIIETQQAEITQLDAFLQVHSAHLNDPEFRSEEHTSELQSIIPLSNAVFCMK